MREDRNGVRTAGLLIMEESWDTAYLWENAEAALAFLDAAEDGGGDAYRRRGRRRFSPPSPCTTTAGTASSPRGWTGTTTSVRSTT